MRARLAPMDNRMAISLLRSAARANGGRQGGSIMSGLELQGVVKRFGAKLPPALDGVDTTCYQMDVYTAQRLREKLA